MRGPSSKRRYLQRVVNTVIVKFTATYCACAHRVAHGMDSAPKLWFCDVVESVGMFGVVMEFVEGRRVDDDKPHLPEKVLEPLRGAISVLHDVGLVHGDLRGPNVIVSEGSGGKHAMLLDFDWGGKEGDVFYPVDINMQLTWHDDVKPGTLNTTCSCLDVGLQLGKRKVKCLQ